MAYTHSWADPTGLYSFVRPSPLRWVWKIIDDDLANLETAQARRAPTSRNPCVSPLLPDAMSRQSTAEYAVVPASTPPHPIQPTPGLIPNVSNPSVTVSPATQLPDATQAGRWGRIRRYPVPITFSIVIFFVLLIIVVMVLTLNSGVQQLYNQVPYNITGVSLPVTGFSCFRVSIFSERGSGGSLTRRSRSWDIIISWTWTSERSRSSGKSSDVERTSCRRVGRHHISEVLRRVDHSIGRLMCI